MPGALKRLKTILPSCLWGQLWCRSTSGDNSINLWACRSAGLCDPHIYGSLSVCYCLHSFSFFLLLHYNLLFFTGFCQNVNEKTMHGRHCLVQLAFIPSRSNQFFLHAALTSRASRTFQRIKMKKAMMTPAPWGPPRQHDPPRLRLVWLERRRRKALLIARASSSPGLPHRTEKSCYVNVNFLKKQSSIDVWIIILRESQKKPHFWL